MSVHEPLRFMRTRLEVLEADLREKQATLPLETDNAHAEIKRRLITGLKSEIAEFRSAIRILEMVPDPVHDLEEKDRVERCRHFGGEPYDR